MNIAKELISGFTPSPKKNEKKKLLSVINSWIKGSLTFLKLMLERNYGFLVEQSNQRNAWSSS